MNRNTTRSATAIGGLLLAASISVEAQRTPPVRGIRFAIDTLETPVKWRGALTRVAGVVEYASGRGRLTVTAIRQGPPVALNGVAVGVPLAKPGDYYLFDSTGFVLVRPTTRTFSSFVFTRADINQSGMLLPGAFLMKYTPIHVDTLDGRRDAARLRQHLPIAILWHLDSLDERGPKNIYARGWLELEDAPAIEAGVARWFGVAAAVAQRRGGASTLPRNNLQITSVALLYPTADRANYVRYMGMLTPLGLSTADVDPGRLLIPAGYAETPWPGFPRARATRASSRADTKRWRTLLRSPHA